MKKVLSFIITLILLCALLTVPVEAVGSGTLSLSDAEGGKGDTVTVNVRITDNPGLITLRFTISWSDGLELTAVSDAGLLNGWTTPSPTISSPYTLRWSDSLSTSDNTATGKIATLTFKIKDDAQLGDERVSLSFRESRNVNGGNNTFSGVSAKISVVCKEHSFGDYTKKDNSDHSRTCSICGFVESRSHAWDNGTVITEATCKDKGSKQVTCAVCGATKVVDIEKLKNHTYGDWERTKEPTCTQKGEQKRECSVCNKVETKSIAALGHNIENATVTKNPTCSKAGTQTGLCTRCNKQVTVSIPAINHSFGEWSVKKAASCTETGIKERKCYTCSKTEQETVEKMAHSFDEYTLIKEPTISSTGLKEAKCVYCDHISKEIMPCAVFDQDTNTVFEAAEGVFAEGTEIKISELTKGTSEYSTAKIALSGISSQYRLFSIKAYLEGAEIQPNGEVTVHFDIPNAYGENVAVYHISNDGQQEKLESVISEDGKTVSVTLSHFSVFAICNTAAKVQKSYFDEGDTDDGNTVAVVIFIIAIVLILGGIVAFLFFKRGRVSYMD